LIESATGDPIVGIRYGRAFAPIGRRLAEREASPEESDVAVDLLRFYFGYLGLFALHDENDLTYECRGIALSGGRSDVVPSL
jgi:hypothetical protein